MRKILKNESVQAFVASVICILAGLLIGYHRVLQRYRKV
jgi:hypothetical protein